MIWPNSYLDNSFCLVLFNDDPRTTHATVLKAIERAQELVRAEITALRAGVLASATQGDAT